MRMLPQEEENDDAAEVTWEDQQRINSFSQLNNRLRHIEGKLEDLKQEREALDDLSSELMMSDEDALVLYKVGEVFLHMPHSRALQRLERDQEGIATQVSSLTETAEDCEKKMKGLKVALYAKFGRAINLDE